MTAKRVRDYKAEERRRNELAVERGHRTRATARYAVKTGKLPSEKPVKPFGPQDAPYRKAGFKSPTAYSNARKDAAAWSRKHSNITPSSYRPSSRHRSPYAFRSYYDAFVNPATRVSGYNSSQRMRALKSYLRDYEDYTESEVTDEKYPGSD